MLEFTNASGYTVVITNNAVATVITIDDATPKSADGYRYTKADKFIQLYKTNQWVKVAPTETFKVIAKTPEELAYYKAVTATITGLSITTTPVAADVVAPTPVEVSVEVAPHTHVLEDLTNVTVTDNTTGEILVWSGTAWVNNTLVEAGITT